MPKPISTGFSVIIKLLLIVFLFCTLHCSQLSKVTFTLKSFNVLKVLLLKIYMPSGKKIKHNAPAPIDYGIILF